MHVAKWSGNLNENEVFDFGNKSHRKALWLFDEFTFGHYKVGDGVITIAGILMAHTEIGCDTCLYYGISMCSPNDNFSKSFGRSNAIANLIGDKTSQMRGVFCTEPASMLVSEPPATIFQAAVKDHLLKIRRLPNWIPANCEVEFRGKRREEPRHIHDYLRL